MSTVHLLKTFIDIDKHTDNDIFWQVKIHLTFVASAVLLAWIERLTTSPSAHRGKAERPAV